MDRINGRLIRYIEFGTSTDWATGLPRDKWLAIIIANNFGKKYIGEVVRKSIDRNVCWISGLGELHELVHELADEEIAFRDADIEPHHLPEHMIVTTSDSDFDEGVWFSVFSASNDECRIDEVVIINATGDNRFNQRTTNLIGKFKDGYVPTK
ncbi:MAG: hypothetical protein RIB71_15255 [Imperialibacter sp.]|uniref:hypothetical protein n=1 Tax=Imperialibacter sp. TaxID=2038411 RepID=UPI0032EBCCFF